LLDLLGLDAMSLRSASYLVLDEADRMLALGFEEQLDAISKGIRKDRQCLLFSATFPLRLQQAAERWLTSHEQVTVRVGTVDVGMRRAFPKRALEEAAVAPHQLRTRGVAILLRRCLWLHPLNRLCTFVLHTKSSESC